VPAAAVIPAPRAYINVVAVKKPVVGFEDIVRGRALVGFCSIQDHGTTLRRCSIACGIVHRPKPPSSVVAAPSEPPHSTRCARSCHCE